MGVPSSIIVPFVGVSFDNSRAVQGTATLPVQACIIGQKISAGTATAGVLYLVSSADDVRTLAGVGSHLHRMATKWFSVNNLTPCYIVALDDSGTGSAATISATLTGTATAAGELVAYVDGSRFGLSVAVGDTAAVAGAALAALINADTTLPVTAAFATGALTLTAKNDGVTAGDVGVVWNYYPAERTPTGLVAGDWTTTPGTGEPDVTAALAAIGDNWFQILVSTYTDGTNLGIIEQFLETQAGAMVQHDGVYYAAKRDTYGNLVTFGTGSSRNCPYVVVIAATGSPESLANVAAAVAAATALSITDDPAVPLHRIGLNLLPAQPSDRFTLAERNTLAKSGVATLTHDNGCQTEATVTMYLKNSAGAADTSYRYQNTVFVLMNLRYTFVQRILSRYARAKLAASAERLRSGQQVITPDIGRAEAISWFQELEAAGQVEGLKQFKNELVCRINPLNPNRLDWILPTDIVNQFIVGSADLQFRL